MHPTLRDKPAPIALGCMNFGKRTDRATSERIMSAACDAGIEMFDTANVYNDGESERIVGAFIRSGGAQARVATKVGLGRMANRNEGLSPSRVLAACDESLGRLGIEVIDLYYLHAPDADTPLRETVSAVSRLLSAGKIQSWGVSNFASWQILELCGYADQAEIPRPVMAQQMYNALIRQLDIEYFAYARAHPIHTTVYNPLAGGLLTGMHQRDHRPAPGSRFDKNQMYQRRYWQDPFFTATDTLKGIAAQHGLSLLELAYAFVFRHPNVDSVLVGPATVAHLDAALGAASVELSPEARRDIDLVALSLCGTDAKYAR